MFPVRFTPEQHVWMNLVKNAGPLECEHHMDANSNATCFSEASIASNCIIVEMNETGVQLPKYQSEIQNSLVRGIHYSYADWRQLVARHEGVPMGRRLFGSLLTEKVSFWFARKASRLKNRIDRVKQFSQTT